MSANQPPGPGPTGPQGTQVMGAVADMRPPAAEAAHGVAQAAQPQAAAPAGQMAGQMAAHHAYHPAAQGQQPLAVPVPAQLTSAPVPGARERLRSFRRSQIYEAAAPADVLLDDLGHIEQVDSRAESQQRWLGRLAWLLGPAALLLAVTGIAPKVVEAVSIPEEILVYVLVGAFFCAFVMMFAYPFLRRRRFPVISQPSGDPTWLKVIVALAGFGLAFGAWPILESLPADTRSPVVIATVVVGLLAIVAHRRRRRHNTEDRRYQLARALLTVLSRDVAAGQALGVRLDLRPPNIKDKLASEEKQAVYGGAARIGKFVDPWLQLRGRFIDGTRFVLSLVEHTTVKNVVKGRKNKFKTKTKRKDRASLELRVKPGKLPALGRIAPQGRGALQLSPSYQLRKFSGTGERLFAEAGFAAQGPESPLSDEHWLSARRECALQLFLGLYQVIHAAKKLGKAA